MPTRLLSRAVLKVRRKVRKALFAPVDALAARVAARSSVAQQRALLGAIAARQVQSVRSIQSLADIEFQVFSQWGEDGVIEWLVDKLKGVPETFIEFGVENYGEANTRFLMCHRNWRGLVFDRSRANVESIKADGIYWRHDLLARAAFITAENINQLIVEAGFQGDIGLLSIDVDGNDYWIWKAIDAATPHILIMEYNAVFGDLLPLTIPYAASFRLHAAHKSGLYFGASIRALCELAHDKGYTFIGTGRSGCNAFFVRNDRASALQGLIERHIAWASRFRSSRDDDRKPTFISGASRRLAIQDCLVTDVSTGRTDRLGAFDPIYSQNWLEQMDGKPAQFGR
jgi:hypothetical protein